MQSIYLAAEDDYQREGRDVVVDLARRDDVGTEQCGHHEQQGNRDAAFARLLPGMSGGRLSVMPGANPRTSAAAYRRRCGHRR